MTQFREIDGSVLNLRCGKCSQTFPHFSFAGETDTDTEGLGSATSCAKNEVVIAELSSTESDALEAGSAGLFEQRLSRQLGRSDLHVVRLLRVEQPGRIAPGASLKDFRKNYIPAVLIYSCACCLDGESRLLSKMTVDEFRRSGGQVSVIGSLTLAPGS